MNCKVYKEMLHSYANDELNEMESAAVSSHLVNCTACSNELAEIKSLKRVLGALKSEGFQLGSMKENIMSIVMTTKKKAAYDIKVLTKLGASMIACGIITLVLNFTGLGDSVIQHVANITSGLESEGQKIVQPMVLINKGLVNMSDKIVNLDGMMFRVGQKIKGGM